QAAERMRDLQIGSLPVCDGDRLVGIVTDRDITVRSTAAGTDPASCRVAQVMTPHVDYCLADDDVQRAVDVIERQQVRKLPVLVCHSRLFGTVELCDFALTVNPEHSGQALRNTSEPG